MPRVEGAGAQPCVAGQAQGWCCLARHTGGCRGALTAALLVVSPQERGIYCWSTATWKRRVLLPPDPKYAGKPLAAGLLAVSGVGGAAVGSDAAWCCWDPLLSGCQQRQRGRSRACARRPACAPSQQKCAGPAPRAVLDAAGQEHRAHGAHSAGGRAQGCERLPDRPASSLAATCPPLAGGLPAALRVLILGTAPPRLPQVASLTASWCRA
jgi:hypothetical protein